MFPRMSMTLALLLCVIAAAFAAVIGVLIGGRGGAVLKAEREAQAENFRKAIKDLEAEIADRKRVQDERDAARLQLAAHESAQAARDEAHTSQLAELRANRESLESQFKALSAQMLEAAQAQFLERAEARFRQSEATSGDALKALLAPVESTLKRYEEGLVKVEAERQDAFGNLTGLMQAMRIGQEKVSDEAAKIVNALRNAPKTRGNWGEQQLRNVLESCGLSEHADFETEVSFTGQDGDKLRPDVVINVPGGQKLVIDAKVSLNAYQDAFSAVDEVERRAHLKLHLDAMRAHVITLGNRSYQSQFGDSLDFVIMFVPGEHFLSAALEEDSGLWDFAFGKRVLLATPTNLIAVARTIAAVWRQEKVAKEARQIGELGKELYDRLAKVGEDFGRVGSSLNNAVKHFNTATNSFNGRLVSTGKKFRDLNIEIGTRELVDVPLVEQLAGHVNESEPEKNDSLIKLVGSD